MVLPASHLSTTAGYIGGGLLALAHGPVLVKQVFGLRQLLLVGVFASMALHVCFDLLVRDKLLDLRGHVVLGLVLA